MRTLTPSEMRQIEKWARGTKIGKMLSFFDTLPRFVKVPRPLLVGSNNAFEILLEGDLTTHQIRSTLVALDEPFDPHLQLQRTVGGKKRERPHGVLPVYYRQLQKGFPELCLLKGKGTCGSTIVRAHSIQKALFKGHAKDGHVYEFDPYNLKRDANDKHWPNLIGINNATAFTGFCNCHDAQVFSAIDDHPFDNTPEQRFLYHYRAFAQAFYARAMKFKTIENTFKEVAQTTSPLEIRSLAEKVEITRQDVIELEAVKTRLERNLEEKKWDEVEGCAFVGDKMADILATDLFAPRKDFQGSIIQDTKWKGPLNWVSLTVTASKDQATVLLCGNRNCPILHKLGQSLRQIPPSFQTRAVVNYVFCHVENLILIPRWWESLSKQDQLQYINAAEARYYPRRLPNVCDWKLQEIPCQSSASA